MLQQHLPFTVLKLIKRLRFLKSAGVATALTVYGIETKSVKICIRVKQKVATALTVYGIETLHFIVIRCC